MCALLANNGGSKHDYSARLTAHFFGIHLSSTVISACAYILIWVYAWYRLYDNEFSESGEEKLKAAAEKRNMKEDMVNLSLC